MENTISNHTTVFRRRVSLGALALMLAGLTLMPQGILTINVPTAPEQNLAFAAGANSLGYRLSMTSVGISLAFFMLGVFALYAYFAQTKQEKLAFAGLIITVGLLALFLPITGFAAFVVPAIGALVAQGQTEIVDVMVQTFKEPFFVIPFLAGILWNIGNILLGTAVWRSGSLWKWSGMLLILYGIVGVPSYLDVKAFQIVAPVVGGLAQIAIGISLWRVVNQPEVPRPG